MNLGSSTVGVPVRHGGRGIRLLPLECRGGVVRLGPPPLTPRTSRAIGVRSVRSVSHCREVTNGILSKVRDAAKLPVPH
jgi:hypothetical protein